MYNSQSLTPKQLYFLNKYYINDTYPRFAFHFPLPTQLSFQFTCNENKHTETDE